MKKLGIAVAMLMCYPLIGSEPESDITEPESDITEWALHDVERSGLASDVFGGSETNPKVLLLRKYVTYLKNPNSMAAKWTEEYPALSKQAGKTFNELLTEYPFLTIREFNEIQKTPGFQRTTKFTVNAAMTFRNNKIQELYEHLRDEVAKGNFSQEGINEYINFLTNNAGFFNVHSNINVIINNLEKLLAQLDFHLRSKKQVEKDYKALGRGLIEKHGKEKGVKKEGT